MHCVGRPISNRGGNGLLWVGFLIACLFFPTSAYTQDPVAACVAGRSIAISGYDEAGFRSAVIEGKTLRIGVETKEGFQAGLDALANAFPGADFLESPLLRGDMPQALRMGLIDATPYSCELVLANPSDFAGRFEALHAWLLPTEVVPPPPPPPLDVGRMLKEMDKQLGDLYREGSDLLGRQKELNEDLRRLEAERERASQAVERAEQEAKRARIEADLADADYELCCGDREKACKIFQSLCSEGIDEGCKAVREVSC